MKAKIAIEEAIPYAPGSTEPPINDTRTLGDLTVQELREILTAMDADVNNYNWDGSGDMCSDYSREDLHFNLGDEKESISSLMAYWKLADERLTARGILNKADGEGGEPFKHRFGESARRS